MLGGGSSKQKHGPSYRYETKGTHKTRWERSECYVRDRDGPLALAVTCRLMLIIVVVLTVVSALLALVALGLLGMLVYRRAR